MTQMAHPGAPRSGVLQRLRAVLSAPAQTQAQLKEMSRRLDRIERQLESLHKIWLKTRHVEPAVQAALRALYLDRDELPYPERLTARRFRLASQNQKDGI